MAVDRPVIVEIENKIYQINEFGLDCMYVICGESRALVVDTGMGYCDFRAIIGELTKLPYDVVITHGHVDHAGGADQFREVWIHPNDVGRAKSIYYERRIEDGDRFRLKNGIWDYGHENVRYWDEFPGIRELYDGQTFDLGGRLITVVYTPGHTYGSCCFLDSKSRIAFVGDALGNVPKSYVSKRLIGLRNLKKHEEEFDRMYGGHAGRMLNSSSKPKRLLDDCIKATEMVLEGKLPLIRKSSHFEHTDSRASAVYGQDMFTFDTDRLRETGRWEPDYQNYCKTELK